MVSLFLLRVAEDRLQGLMSQGLSLLKALMALMALMPLVGTTPLAHPSLIGPDGPVLLVKTE